MIIAGKQQEMGASAATFETRLSDLSQKSLFYFSRSISCRDALFEPAPFKLVGDLQIQLAVRALLVVESHILTIKLACPVCCFPTVFFEHRFLLDSYDLRVTVELQYLF